MGSLVVFALVTSQAAKVDERVVAMEKLSMLVGDWHGKGWSLGRDGKKAEFFAHETMKREAGGCVLGVTGRHWTVVDGKEVPNYEAFGFVTYDVAEGGRYRLENHINGGGIQRFDLSLLEGGFGWKIGDSVDVSLRVIDGKWVEQAWRTVGGEKQVFFEIVMEKKSAG